MPGSSITIRFHWRWGKTLIWKHKNVPNSLRDRMFQLIIHMKAKAWVFPFKFCNYFILLTAALPIAKSWIQLRTNTLHYHFVFLSPGSCFISAICIQLESAPISDRLVFAAVEDLEGWQNYSPKRFEDSVDLDFPFRDHLNIDYVFPFYVKWQRSYYP